MNISIRNVSESVKEDLKAIAVASGKSEAVVMRDAFDFYVKSKDALVQRGHAIMAEQKRLNEEEEE